MAAEELKNCPFCGNVPTVEVDDYGEIAYVYCPRGGCAIGYERISPRDWNQRPDTVESGATSTNRQCDAISLDDLKKLLDEFLESELGESHEALVGSALFYDWYSAKQRT